VRRVDPASAPGGLTAIARAAGLPLVGAAHGVFGWARPGDLLAVDGDAGVVVVNPPPADVERVRRQRSTTSRPRSASR
jgi:phosphoenolpyruvate-protein kinase (PTS system EI component)